MAEITLDVQNLLTYNDAAKELGVSRPTVYNLVDKYNLHPFVIGINKYLIRHEVDFLKSKVKERRPETLETQQPTDRESVG